MSELPEIHSNEPAAGSAGEDREANSSHRHSRRHSSRHHHSSHSEHVDRVCPRCGSTRVNRARRIGSTELFFLPLLLSRPFQCHACLHRFYGFSSGNRTKRRAFISVCLVTVLGMLLWGAWRLVSYISEQRPPTDPVIPQ